MKRFLQTERFKKSKGEESAGKSPKRGPISIHATFGSI